MYVSFVKQRNIGVIMIQRFAIFCKGLSVYILFIGSKASPYILSCLQGNTHESWLAGRGSQVVVAELIPVI